MITNFKIFENHNQLRNDINEFILLNNYEKLITSMELTEGLCDTISNELKIFLDKKGYKTEMVDLYRPRFNYGDSIWRVYKPKHVVHTILKVNNKYVDLTGAQYNNDLSGIKIYERNDLKKYWSYYKVWGIWKRNYL